MYGTSISKKRGQGRTHATSAEYLVLRIEYFVMDSCDQIQATKVQ